MPWIYLLLAGAMETIWPMGLKFAQTQDKKVLGIVLTAVCIPLGGGMLWLAQKTIPIGTAYAVWTGIGTSGTFVIGILLFGESANWLRVTSALLIVLGIIGLRLSQTN